MKFCALGGDLGGSGARLVPVNEEGILKDPNRKPYEPNISGSLKTVEEFSDFVRKAYKKFKADGLDPQFVSWAAAGAYLPDGTCTDCPNAHWMEGHNIRLLTTEATGLPAKNYGDMVGSGRGAAQLFPHIDGNFYVLTLSTGYGGALVVQRPDEKVIVLQGEPGHVSSVSGQVALRQRCNCGGPGDHDEAWISGDAVAEMIVHGMKSGVGTLPAGWETNPCRYADDAWRRNGKNDGWIRDLYTGVAQRCGLAFYGILHHHHTAKALIVKGQFGARFIELPGILDIIRETMAEHAMSGQQEKMRNIEIIPMIFGDIKDKDAFIGAVWLAFEEGVLRGN